MAGILSPIASANKAGQFMQRRDFNCIVLGVGLSPIWANTAVAQVIGQTGTFAQTPAKNGVAAMSTNDPMAAVRQYIDAFNKGDAKLMAATFTVPGAILDGMAPHLWLGPTAAQDWYRDVLVEGEQHGASDYFVTAGEPLHDVTGDSAYIVVPATMTFKVRGKQVTQSGAAFTVALRKLPRRVAHSAAWAWAKGTPR